jgi:hypothetical protein
MSLGGLASKLGRGGEPGYEAGICLVTAAGNNF